MTVVDDAPRPTGRMLDREIVALALPALGSLAADPLVSMVDTAFVGRLGVTPLAATSARAGWAGRPTGAEAGR